jgi:lysozyme
MFALGEAGRRLIQSFEKLALDAYSDQGGVWTIGWGHTGPDVHAGLTCAIEDADRWFAKDTATAVAAVNAGLNSMAAARITQNQFDALVSFTFNVGAGAEAHSTLMKRINLLDFTGAALEFPKWDHVNGVPSLGLARRREAEQALFTAA